MSSSALAQRRHREIKNIETEIVNVVLDIFVDQKGAIGADLPQAGDSRLYRQTLLLQWRVVLDDEGHFRSWSNE